MNWLLLTWHLLNFVAPGVVLGSGLALALWVIRKPYRQTARLGVQMVVNSCTAVAVSMLGLAWFGRDGKMTTYLCMALAVALVQLVWPLKRR